MTSTWRYLGGTVFKPLSTFRALQSDPRRLSKGLKTVLVVGLLYAITSALLAVAGAVVTVPEIIPLPTENYYFYEMFFALPVFLLAWVLTACFVRLTARAGGGTGTFKGSLAASGFALAVPAIAVWIPDTVFAVLMLLGVSQAEFMNLTAASGPLQGLAVGYQIAAAIWMIILFALAVRTSQRLRRGIAALAGFAAALVFFGLIYIFIR